MNLIRINEVNIFDDIATEAKNCVENGELLDLETITGKNRTVNFPIMEKLAHKIEKATNVIFF